MNVAPRADVHERIGRAMGAVARVVIVGGPDDLLDRAFDRVAVLERRWSRFDPSSELSRVNAAGGAPCIVSDDTVLLVEAMVDGWRRSAGRFDPTVLDAVVALGYDAPWPIDAPSGRLSSDGAAVASGCRDIFTDRPTGFVWLPPRVALDPGGIGKGLAADLVAAMVMAGGARGVLVDLGGDLRVLGRSPSGPTWRLSVEDPADPDRFVAVVETSDGAVATTSRRRRHWTTVDGVDVHHVVDPRTGSPAASSWTSATALAPSAAAAEVAATVLFVDPQGPWSPDMLAGVLASDDGSGCAVVGARPDLVRLLGVSEPAACT